MHRVQIYKRTKTFGRHVYDTARYLARKRELQPDITEVCSILFICYGNICRSPFAEYYARDIFKARGIDIEVMSGGLTDQQGKSSPKEAVISARLLGVDLERHRSRLVTREMIYKSSLTVGMHNFHFESLIRLFPAEKRKYYLLKHLVWPRYLLLDIDDPFGKLIEDYSECFAEIKECIDILSDRIIYRKDRREGNRAS